MCSLTLSFINLLACLVSPLLEIRLTSLALSVLFIMSFHNCRRFLQSIISWQSHQRRRPCCNCATIHDAINERWSLDCPIVSIHNPRERRETGRIDRVEGESDFPSSYTQKPIIPLRLASPKIGMLTNCRVFRGPPPSIAAML